MSLRSSSLNNYPVVKPIVEDADTPSPYQVEAFGTGGAPVPGGGHGGQLPGVVVPTTDILLYSTRFYFLTSRRPFLMMDPSVGLRERSATRASDNIVFFIYYVYLFEIVNKELI
jgi:hypothetical protein